MPLLPLLILPASAGLEVTSSELVSRRPDGLGPVMQADLDGDGDDDLLLSGKNNHFLGWIEGTSQGHGSNLRPINTGEIAVADRSPAVVALDGSPLPDLHFPGWRLPNLFRRYGPPEPYPATAGHEFLAHSDSKLVTRDPATGEWHLHSPTASAPLQVTNSFGTGTLKSASSPKPGNLIFGDFDRDGIRDLIAVLEDAQTGDRPVLRGIQGFRGTATGFQGPYFMSSLVPEHLAPMWSPTVAGRLSALLYATDQKPPDKPAAPAGTRWLGAFWSDSLGFTEPNEWVFHTVPDRILQLSASPANSVFQSRFQMRVVTGWSQTTGEFRSYRITGDGPNAITFTPVIPGEPGLGEILPLKNSTSLLMAHRSLPDADGNTIQAAETLRLFVPGEQPADHYGLPYRGKLVAGPFGRLDSAEWIEPDGNGVVKLLASTKVSEAVMLFDTRMPQNPLTLAPAYADQIAGAPTDPASKPLAADFDRDGDLDILRNTAGDGYSSTLFWENGGEGAFSFASNRYPAWSPWWSREPYEAVRVEDRDTPAGRFLSVLSSRPGQVYQTILKSPLPWDSPYWSQPVVFPGATAKVVLADRDLDGDGDKDFLFYPSVFGNVLALGKWNPEGYLDSLESVSAGPAETSISKLHPGDLDGDGTTDLFAPALDATGLQVNWLAVRHSTDTLIPFDHPALTLPAPAARVFPADLDGDGDIDLVRASSSSIPPEPDGVHSHELRWSEYIGGIWIHHDTLLGTLRLQDLEPAWRQDAIPGGQRLLIVNRIGEMLAIETRVTTSTSVAMNGLLAVKGIRGASSDSLADPDGDGIPNYAEILAGTSPLIADPGFSIPLRPLRAGESSGWVATLPISLEEYGIGARIETSTDMSHWTRHDPPPLPLGPSDAGHRYLFRDLEVNTSTRRFVRIVFDQP